MSKIYYSSDEMFSSTDLIRKSKPIFDLLVAKSIEKAVILRDGKPSFILLDFFEYEKLMKDYISLKSQNSKSVSKLVHPSVNIETSESEQKTVENETDDEIGENEYKLALSEIENLEIDYDDKKTKAPLKEFWDE